jgi:hypothetical protein
MSALTIRERKALRMVIRKAEPIPGRWIESLAAILIGNIVAWGFVYAAAMGWLP